MSFVVSLSIFFLSSISLLVLCRFFSCLSVSLFSHKVIADHLHDDSNDPGTRIGNKEDVETSVGWEYSKIHRILVPTVPMTDRIMGTVDDPMPLRAPGKRSMIPQRK